MENQYSLNGGHERWRKNLSQSILLKNTEYVSLAAENTVLYKSASIVKSYEI